MNRKISALLLTLTLLFSCCVSAQADLSAAGAFDTVTTLLTGTENVTLTGSATFSLDGEAFKYVETTYVQDGVNSRWVLNLSSPRQDGSVRENGFTVIANDRFKYGMEVYTPGIYTIAEDDPQAVILRPSAALSQLISLGHAILEQLPALPEDVLSLSKDQWIIRMEEKDIPEALSNLISLGTFLAIQRTMNITDDSIAAPPYPEEAGTMKDYVTPTQAIIYSTQKYELTQLSADAKLDEAGRLTEANGTARLILHTFLDGEHELHISFAGKASDYGTSAVPPFQAAEYGVEPAEGTILPRGDDFPYGGAQESEDPWEDPALEKAAEIVAERFSADYGVMDYYEECVNEYGPFPFWSVERKNRICGILFYLVDAEKERMKLYHPDEVPSDVLEKTLLQWRYGKKDGSMISEGDAVQMASDYLKTAYAMDTSAWKISTSLYTGHWNIERFVDPYWVIRFYDQATLKAEVWINSHTGHMPAHQAAEVAETARQRFSEVLQSGYEIAGQKITEDMVSEDQIAVMYLEGENQWKVIINAAGDSYWETTLDDETLETVDTITSNG